jgi:effector-binding domain-containing protein
MSDHRSWLIRRAAASASLSLVAVRCQLRGGVWVAVRHRAGGHVTLAVGSDQQGQPGQLGAMGEVAATLSAQDISPAGPLGGIFDTELFTEDRGRVTIFLPCDPLPQPVGRVRTTVIPPAELATIVHLGSSTEVDRTYGALADYVTQHALAVDGPIREYYLVGPSDTPDESLWRTEVGWPIFQTRPRP